MNKSGIKPCGHALLCKVYTPPKKGLLVMPTDVSDRLRMQEIKVEVLDIGPAAWDDEKVPRAEVGDVVLISKFAGAFITGQDDIEYRMINDRDVYAVWEKVA